MRVVHWSKKLTFGDKEKQKMKLNKTKKDVTKTKLRKSVSSISKFLYSTPLRSLRSHKSHKEIVTNDSPVLLPLTIRLDSVTSDQVTRLRPRSQTLCNRTELRNILQQRFTQRIMERSIAAVILEAKQELQQEANNNLETLTEAVEPDDVYVPFEFNDKKMALADKMSFEEDFYMVMS